MLGTGARRQPLGRATIHVAVILALAFGVLAGAAGYWGVVAAPDLVRSPNDAAVIAAAGDPLSDAFGKFGADRYDPKALTLSLSLDLQTAAVAALGKHRGAVVMLDPRTGEILALASTPTYDASAVADPTTARATFEALQADPTQPLLPRATLGRYVPGSVFKIVTAMAGLGSGAITPSTTFKQQPGAEKNGLVVGGFRVKDGHHPATGTTALDLVGATEVSCNIYYALTGLQTGGPATSTTR